MVVVPSRPLFDDMLQRIDSLRSYDGGDTGFLNAYFTGWYASGADHRLPFGYNALRTMHWLTAAKQPGYWKSIQPLKIIHYCSSPKVCVCE
jgi:glycogenin glucosyltransferase